MHPTLPRAVREKLSHRAAELGFARAGFVRAAPSPRGAVLDRWLEAGMQGELGWMEQHAAIRKDASLIEPWARSVMVLAIPYALPRAADPVISHYAQGDDYHDQIRLRLRALGAFAEAELGARFRPAVDSAPLWERDLAERAGLGWLGKSGMVLHPDLGSAFFLASLVLDAELEEEAAPQPDRCGSCTRCMTACPTGAIVAPGVVDARRCIAYLTIELRGPIPRPLRPAIGHRLFGCDICQTVCPWNLRWERADSWPELAPRAEVAELTARELCTMTQEAFSLRFRGSPLKRTKRVGLVRNATVVLGNSGDRGNLAILGETLQSHDEPLVRGHAAWAIGRLGGATAALLLERARAMEEELYVRDEIAAAEASR
jgi:epoxyqueuosine reductase